MVEKVFEYINVCGSGITLWSDTMNILYFYNEKWLEILWKENIKFLSVQHMKT